MTDEQRVICAERIKEQRQSKENGKGWSQEKLADEVVKSAYSDGVSITMSWQTILNYEKGKFPDKFYSYDENTDEYSGKLKYIAQALDVYPAWLINRLAYRDEKERMELESTAWWRQLQELQASKSIEDRVCDDPSLLLDALTRVFSSARYSVKLLESKDSEQLFYEIKRNDVKHLISYENIQTMFKSMSDYMNHLLLTYSDQTLSIDGNGHTERFYKVESVLYEDGKEMRED